jgi:hypothetical protein
MPQKYLSFFSSENKCDFQPSLFYFLGALPYQRHRTNVSHRQVKKYNISFSFLIFFLFFVTCVFERFLGYEFSTYGWDVLTLNNMNPEDRADPMNVVFPKVLIMES